MPSNLLLLPLLGGYCFVHFCHYFRFRSQRLDGYRLLIESAFAGLFLAALSRVFLILLMRTPFGATLNGAWDLFCPFPYSGTAAGSVLLGLALPILFNRVRNEAWSKNKVLERHGNALFKLLHDSARSNRPIAVTLSNRKWYMGYVRDSPNLDPQEQYFALIPVLSGYRDSDNLTVEQTVFYEPAQVGHDRNDFAITIPLDSVQIAHYFDPEVYDKFFARRRSRKKQTKLS